MKTAKRTDTQSPALHVADRHDLIRVQGARVNNLKDISVELPKRRLTVFTGVSGSGKSSLVFSTIAAESQRLINETYSAFLQGFMPTLARPEVDVLDGLTTAIIVDQERMGVNPRSTVGTATRAARSAMEDAAVRAGSTPARNYSASPARTRCEHDVPLVRARATDERARGRLTAGRSRSNTTDPASRTRVFACRVRTALGTWDDEVAWSRAHAGAFQAETVEDLHRELLLVPAAFARDDVAAPVELLRKHHEPGDPSAVVTALLLLTDRSWIGRRARQVASIVGCEVLNEACLDEIAERVVHAEDLAVAVPRAWFEERYSIEIEIPLRDAAAQSDDEPDSAPSVDEEIPSSVPCRRKFTPPSRSWAAQHLVRRDGTRLQEILTGAEPLPLEDRAAIEAGVVRGAIDLEDEGRLSDEAFRTAVDVGLRSPRGAYRLEALKLLARREPDDARAMAWSDPDAKVRRWAQQSGIAAGPQDALPGRSLLP